MDGMLHWFEAHPGLAGYAQTLGSLIALFVAIAMPVWQRRGVERAAELSFRVILQECHAALSVVECLCDEDEFDVPGAEIDPAQIAQGLSRAAARLERVSLFEFRPQCAALVQQLQREMSIAAAQVEVYVDRADEGAALDLYDHDQDERVYRLMLEILNAMRGFRDPELAAHLGAQLQSIEERKGARPRLKRVIVKPAWGSNIEKVLRSIRLSLSSRQTT